MECIKCEGTQFEEAISQKVFFDKIIVSNVKVQKCKKCGSELLREDEYEKLRKMVNEVELKIPQSILARVKVLML